MIRHGRFIPRSAAAREVWRNIPIEVRERPIERSRPNLIKSDEDAFDDFAMNVSEAKVATLKTVGEFFVIDAEAMQDCGIQVMDGHGILDDVVTKVVGLPVADARPDTAAGQPDRVTAAMMIAAVIVLFDL